MQSLWQAAYVISSWKTLQIILFHLWLRASYAENK